MELSIRGASKVMGGGLIIGFLGCFALALIVGSFFMLPSSSEAADTDVDITVASVLSLTMDKTTASAEVTPTSSGNLMSSDMTASVATNNATGYTLSMSAATTGDRNMTRTGSTEKILNSTNVAAGVLATNTWGYNLNTGATPTTYRKIPSPTAPAVLMTTTAHGNGSTKVTVAANVDISIPAGTYESELTFTAVGNYVPVPLSKTGDDIQTVTIASCPDSRIRVVDARDGSTYWVQKLADGKCWMLTNLAYGGGGTNTYNDTKSINLNSTTSGATFTSPEYYIPTGSNRTTGTTDPSTATSGTGQYGYLYNWCAAMGAQTSTSACANATTPAPNTSISICPSGWRLPTGYTTGELQAMADAIRAANSVAGSTALRSTWLGMYSGLWYNGFSTQGSDGYYWSSTQSGATHAHILSFIGSGVYPSVNYNKFVGFAVRCVAV